MPKTYPQSAYTKNQVPWVENEDYGWGPYHWPGGVPSNLRGTAHTADGTPVVVRKELVELVQTLIDYTEKVLGYPLHSKEGGWSGGYANRAIGGTSTPSAHSRARAIDFNAVWNPQSWTFISTWPPAAIKAWIECGFYWGGWYTGVKTDTMHLTYCRTPSGVAADLKRAKALLGDASKTPSKPVEKPKPSKPVDTGTPAASKAEVTLSGLTVYSWQIALNVMGYQTTVDNISGPKTTRATSKSQKRLGVTVDNYVGAKTWAAAVKFIEKAYPLTGGRVFGLALQPGTRSDGTKWSHLTVSGDSRWDSNQPGMTLNQAKRWIRVIQYACQWKHGAPKGRWADGVYEQPTADFIKKAQRAYGIAVDGMTGPTTWNHLLTAKR